MNQEDYFSVYHYNKNSVDVLESLDNVYGIEKAVIIFLNIHILVKYVNVSNCPNANGSEKNLAENIEKLLFNYSLELKKLVKDTDIYDKPERITILNTTIMRDISAPTNYYYVRLNITKQYLQNCIDNKKECYPKDAYSKCQKFVDELFNLFMNITRIHDYAPNTADREGYRVLYDNYKNQSSYAI